ncbi:MAG: isoaspartyl peptidase/L-asparaginase, partial [Candidatus Obscuribacterales bacterium]|nr:isoaspartyl peptidase/L-asparaginase [Candidatus Obscuribacterales bacterium]
AALMDGCGLKSGAVTGINCVKNPIMAARAVMDHSAHLLLSGSGANAFARRKAAMAGLKIVAPDYFVTQKSWRSLEQFLKDEKESSGSKNLGLTTGSSQGDGIHPRFSSTPDKFGTVGAVGLDAQGNLAAATSTGGTTGKDPGRIGDSPIIGAGTYADNHSCAVSATGLGEYFMRVVAAHEISVLMKHCDKKVKEAARIVIFDGVEGVGGAGGVIVLDAAGDYAAPFNTKGMFRGVVSKDGKVEVSIF